MTAALESVENPPLVVRMTAAVVEMNDNQFFEANRELRIEHTANQDILIMSPTGARLGRPNAIITMRLGNGTDGNGTGVVWLLPAQWPREAWTPPGS